MAAIISLDPVSIPDPRSGSEADLLVGLSHSFAFFLVLGILSFLLTIFFILYVTS